MPFEKLSTAMGAFEDLQMLKLVNLAACDDGKTTISCAKCGTALFAVTPDVSWEGIMLTIAAHMNTHGKTSVRIKNTMVKLRKKAEGRKGGKK